MVKFGLNYEPCHRPVCSSHTNAGIDDADVHEPLGGNDEPGDAEA